MSKKELRSSAKPRRGEFANGAGELRPGLLQIAQMIMGIAIPIQLHQDIGRSSALLPRVGNAARVDCRQQLVLKR